jgi:hypothetical protein
MIEFENGPLPRRAAIAVTSLTQGAFSMATPVTVAAFTEIAEAEETVSKLIDGGISAEKISVLAKDMQCEKQVHGFVTSCDVAKKVATGGAWLGGLFGVLAGAAFIWVPGAGPLVVAGSLASALLGGVEGAVAAAATGGVLGWLSALGIEKKHILKFEDHLKAGRYLVVVTGSVEDLEKADSILSETEHAGLHLHTETAA